MARKLRPQLTLVGKRDITLNGLTISYTIERSMIARHVRLEIRRETGLIVVVPKRYPLGELPALLQKKQQWVLGNLQQHREADPMLPVMSG